MHQDTPRKATPQAHTLSGGTAYTKSQTGINTDRPLSIDQALLTQRKQMQQDVNKALIAY